MNKQKENRLALFDADTEDLPNVTAGITEGHTTYNGSPARIYNYISYLELYY